MFHTAHSLDVRYNITTTTRIYWDFEVWNINSVLRQVCPIFILNVRVKKIKWIIGNRQLLKRLVNYFLVIGKSEIKFQNNYIQFNYNLNSKYIKKFTNLYDN